jgi:hypothetical protein
MAMVRILPILTLAAFLAGCTSVTQMLQTQGYISTDTAQPDRPRTAELRSEAKKPTPPAPKPPAPKLATASTASDKATITTSAKGSITNSDKGTMSATTPKTGSPEWEKETAENERKERHLKQVIENICRGC